MLVLTRSVGQDLIASGDMGGERAVFTILGVKGNKVRIGIDAHKDFKVNRKEVQNRIDEEGKCNDIPC